MSHCPASVHRVQQERTVNDTSESSASTQIYSLARPLSDKHLPHSGLPLDTHLPVAHDIFLFINIWPE
jgi:hypothetical protein